MLKVSRTVGSAFLVSTGLLVAGCSGNTYGTGVSSEAQLAKDLGGIVSLGVGSKEKTVIDYNARPKLVKVAKADSLPTPSETVEGESTYFPTDPEEARAKRLRENSSDPTLDDDGSLGSQSVPGGRSPRKWTDKVDLLNKDPSSVEMRRESINGREDRAKRIAEINGTGVVTGPRRYLTEPPVDYRTPAQTAEVGNVGEKEVDRRKKKSESWFDNPFKGIFGG